jgi:hypothetical protein
VPIAVELVTNGNEGRHVHGTRKTADFRAFTLVDGETEGHDEQLIRLKFTPTILARFGRIGIDEELRSRDEPI